MWTPSSPHFMSWSTTFAKLSRRKSVRVLKPPFARARSSPSLSSPAGAASTAKGTSIATLLVICEELSLLCQAATVQPSRAPLYAEHRGDRREAGEDAGG